jgi:PAS domain S-box-containing protein
MKVLSELQRHGWAIVACCAGIVLAWMTAAPYAYLLIAIALTALVSLLIRYGRGAQASHQNDRETRLIVDNMPGFAWSAGPDGSVRYLNRHILDYTGKRAEDLRRFDGRASHGRAEVVHPEDLDRTVEAWAHSVETGEPYVVEHRIRRFDATYRWFRGSAMPLRDRKGRVTRWFDAFFVSDCSGGITPEAHEDAKARMIQAGARPMSWVAVYGEWAPDYTSPERRALGDVTSKRGGIAALIGDYVFAQVEAGLVPPPSFTSVPAKAGSARAASKGGAAGTKRAKGYQLWVALPPEMESMESEAQYLGGEHFRSHGPARVILGRHGEAASKVSAPPTINYLDVALKKGEKWRYAPPDGHTVAWVAVHEGKLATLEIVDKGALARARRRSRKSESSFGWKAVSRSDRCHIR